MPNILAFVKLNDVYLFGSRTVLRKEGDVETLDIHPAETAREREITDLVEGKAGGSIRVGFCEENRLGYAYIVEVPEEQQDLLIKSPSVEMVYTGRIPRSTVRKYDSQLKLAARIWDALREKYASQALNVVRVGES